MQTKGKYYFTSESVTEGHPDKVADQISDAILDTLLAQDANAHVACETLVTTGMAVIAGEITTSGYADLPHVVRETIKHIGYDSSDMGFDWETCAVISSIDKQSPDIAQGVDERLRKFEPLAVTVDGREFRADPAEKREFEAALAVFRSGKFPEAATAFGSFMRQYPQSGYLPSARFWLGNAQYATRDYKEAINNFKSLLAAAPDHARAPEAALSIANCQIELKDTRAARKTLEDLMRVYPQSEAAAAAKERLARLK